ncbi:MAG: hypothetical protein A2283_18775 [Lentisphaerae bacterium RIFOXYA12_FULL_48_11]|nr:MAG: hypothetical protein A2283_18775 [Lentisphaerae bacterium RIFOXYA12_FULL_48_11]
MKKIFHEGFVLFIALCLYGSPVFSQVWEKYDSTFFQLSLWNPVQIVPEDIDVLGLRLNLIYGENRDSYGLDLGLVNSLTRDMLGAQAGLLNVSRGEMRGIQIGLDNIVGNIDAFGLEHPSFSRGAPCAYGLQFGAFNLIYPKGVMMGAQVGIINVADKIQGLQVGIVNCAKDMTGIQIGLINYNDSAEFYLSPVVNACF